ncbi:C-type lectin domain family 4 member E [Merluccius polli]|uniref:C-type lectin domain family 4 member E n=1 Tax=Merluccius polli TaxID=89951 RepID=A0AA47MGI2_MERPO|nr:C-type lectin domain family 4 member E [Merluccius polli]
MDPSAREAAYCKLVDDVDDDAPRAQFIPDAERRGIPTRGVSRFWAPPGFYRCATMFLTVLCLVLLIILIADSFLHHSIVVSFAVSLCVSSAVAPPAVSSTAAPPAVSSAAAPPAVSSAAAPPAVPSAAAALAVSSTAAAPVTTTAAPPVTTTVAPPVTTTVAAPVTTTVAPPVTTTVAPPSGCPKNWLLFQGSCYSVSRQNANWKDAQQRCAKDGGHLAIVLTPEAQGFLWDLLPRGHWNSYWIGLSDKDTEDEWTWVDGTPLTESFWEDGEPNNHIDEDCVYIVKTMKTERVAVKSWYDAPCDMYLPFICQKFLGPTPTTAITTTPH